jgi:hypothetical protein
MSSRYPIHKDWCHVSHDGPCLREDQPAPTPTVELDIRTCEQCGRLTAPAGKPCAYCAAPTAPTPTTADSLTLLRNKFRCEIAPDGDYRKCGHVWHAPMFTIEETDSILAALLAARDDARVILTCRRCGFHAGNRAIFETHWQTYHAALAATPEET